MKVMVSLKFFFFFLKVSRQIGPLTICINEGEIYNLADPKVNSFSLLHIGTFDH